MKAMEKQKASMDGLGPSQGEMARCRKSTTA